MKVHHLNCGTMCPRGARLLAGKGRLLAPAKLIAHCLLIEAGDSLVLVDTGFGAGDAADPKRLGQPYRALVRPQCEIGETAVRQIAALGLDPADVRDIVVTHLDLDHAGGLGDFPQPRVHVFAPELAAAMDAYFHHGEVSTPPSCPRGLRAFQAINAHDGKARKRNLERLRELAREHDGEVSMICSHDPELLV